MSTITTHVIVLLRLLDDASGRVVRTVEPQSQRRTDAARSQPLPWRAILLVAMTVLGSHVPAHATAIALWRTPTEVIAVADTLVVTGGGQRVPYCKLLRVNPRVSAAVGGLLFTGPSAADFHLTSLVHAVLQGPAPMPERLARLDAALLEAYRPIVAVLRAENPGRASMIGRVPLPASVAVFWLDDARTPQLHATHVRRPADDTKPITIERTGCWPCGPQDYYYQPIGSCMEAIQPVLDRYRSLYFWDAHRRGILPGEAVRDLVALAIKTTPEQCGGPLEGLRMHATEGTEWIRRLPGCPPFGDGIR